jgi:hypothetical protein
MSIFNQVRDCIECSHLHYQFQDIFPSILSKLIEVDQTVLYFASKKLREYKLSLCKKKEVYTYAVRKRSP